MIERNDLDSRIEAYVEICAMLYRKVAQEIGPPPRDKVMFWVPNPDSDFAHGKVNWSVKEKEVVDWDSYVFPMNRAFENHLQSSQTIQEIVNLSDVPETRVRFVLSNLALRTGFRAKRGSRERLVREIRTIVTRDVQHDPGPSLTRAYVLGGWVQGRRKLDDRTWLRPPSPSDFPPMEFSRYFQRAFFDRITPHSILEARYGEGEKPQGGEINDWLTSLRLATGFPLTVPESHHTPVGPTAFGMSVTTSSPHVATGHDPLEISRKGISLARNIHAVMQRKPRPSYVEAAIDRVGRSFDEPSSTPQRLLYTIMGFEALLLGVERGQTRALSNRLGVFLGFNEGNGVTLRDRIRSAYRLRSKYVHGADFKPKEVRELDGIYPALREDLCHAILAALVLGISKRRLLEVLDGALVDTTAATRFHRRIFKEFTQHGLGGILSSWGSRGSG
jgi:hypothetical protein